MQPLNVVILQSDAEVAQNLQNSLQSHFNFIYLARGIGEARAAIPKYRAQVVILDLEVVSRSEVEWLRREFPGICLVCTHRLADEEMWTEMVGAGASDLCYSADSQGILSAALRSARGGGAKSIAA
jgi:DNA-binding NarL/FixJ family response regulator